MASLKYGDKCLLEAFFDMGGGYVLNFSDRTFAEFFRDFKVDINSPQYLDTHSGSKANRLRTFWNSAPDSLVGRVIEELIDYAESYRPEHPTTDRARAVAHRLQGADEGFSRAVAPAYANQAPSSPRSGGPSAFRAKRPIEVFFSYAHEDETLMDFVRLQLVVRERIGEIVKWHDRKIPAGDVWRSEIDDRIERADVILLFMSPHFLTSRYCYEVEGEIALRRHREGTARVIPVVLRPCDWSLTPFGELQALPKDGIPITQWPDRDQASLDVARGIMEAIR